MERNIKWSTTENIISIAKEEKDLGVSIQDNL